MIEAAQRRFIGHRHLLMVWRGSDVEQRSACRRNVELEQATLEPCPRRPATLPVVDHRSREMGLPDRRRWCRPFCPAARLRAVEGVARLGRGEKPDVLTRASTVASEYIASRRGRERRGTSKASSSSTPARSTSSSVPSRSARVRRADAAMLDALREVSVRQATSMTVNDGRIGQVVRAQRGEVECGSCVSPGAASDDVVQEVASSSAPAVRRHG